MLLNGKIRRQKMKATKKVYAIIRNDRNEVCYTIKDVLAMALARNESLSSTKKYIINNYKDYKVEFIVK
jgi:hypothetical protein